MFNLDNAISEWRQQMLAVGIKTPGVLDELESHLRDEIEQQTKSGLSEGEAFRSAVQKIGQAHVLQNEFKHNERTKEAREWKLKETALVAGTSLFSLVMGSCVVFGMGTCAELTAGQEMSALAALTTMILFVYGGRLSQGIIPAIHARRNRDVVFRSTGVLLMFWWIAFFYLILPHQHLTMAQLVVTIFWALVTPAGAWLGLFWGIETAARKKVTMTVW